MKRFVCIVLFFIILAVPILSSCTFYCGDYACRGMGYEFLYCNLDICYILCDACALTFGGNEAIEKDGYIAIEGVDYSKPEIYGLTGNSFIFRMDAYADLHINMEICIMQDSILLYSFVYEGNVTEENDLRLTVLFDNPGYDEGGTVYHHHKYNENGGDMYCIINRFEVYKVNP